MYFPVEQIGSMRRNIDYELNRLAGTLVNDFPTLGPATAAKWWLGITDPWCIENLAPMVLATGGSAGEITDVTALQNQHLEVVTGNAKIGNERLRVTSTMKSGRESTIITNPIKVEPWHFYTASCYTLAEQEPKRGVMLSLGWMNGDQVAQITDGELQASKGEWNKAWVTGVAPEFATHVIVKVTWDQLSGEAFGIDMMNLHNGNEPAWALPGYGNGTPGALQAHLNMCAGIFNPDDFVSVPRACNMLAKSSGLEAASALSGIHTPETATMVAHR